MFEYKKIRTFSIVFGACALIAAATATAAISQRGFHPGAKVEYKAQNWPEKWEIGTFVKELPGGTQVLIREKPNEFHKEGFERAYALAEVRPVTRKEPAPNNPEARNAPPAQPSDPPEKAEPEPTAASEADAGAGLMSRQDVLAFLRKRLGNGDPFMNPKREQALQELRKEILSRGVSFRYHSIGEFANDIGKFGPPTAVTAALFENYGALAKRDSLFGKWLIAKVGATTTFERGGDVYQRQEYGASAGSLIVNPNGSYVWDSPSGVLKGQWRKATAEEMGKSDKGGEGLVLLSAKSGADWLVFKRNEEGSQGEGIKISDLATRNLRERGTRR